MANNLRIEKATYLHGSLLAPRVPDYAVDGLLASSGRAPAEVLFSGITRSAKAYTILHNDEVLAMYGIIPQGILNVALLWGLNSDAIHTHHRSYILGSREVVRLFLEEYSILVQYLYAKHTKLIEFARRIGFEIGEPEPYGLMQEPFRRILLKKENFHV